MFNPPIFHFVILICDQKCLVTSIDASVDPMKNLNCNTAIFVEIYSNDPNHTTTFENNKFLKDVPNLLDSVCMQIDRKKVT